MAVLEASSGKYDINPEPARLIAAGDKLVMLGEISQLAELREKVEI